MKKSNYISVKISIVLTAFILPSFSVYSTQKSADKYISKGRINYTLSKEDGKMLDTIQYKTFQYFMNEHHPEKGIVKDRAKEGSPASIAATGFALPAYAVGVERKWISREKAADITLKTLRYFANAIQSNTDSLAVGYKGFFYHFIGMESGKRQWNCELSSIDTGILMMGVIFVRNYYDQNSADEKEIRDLADKLLGRLDWSIFYMDEKSKQPSTISMAWSPEEGTTNWSWHGYTEGLFLYVLAAGTGIESPEKTYNGWLRTYSWKTPYPGLSHVTFPPLFGHQFSECFIDFRGLADPYLKEKKIDYFENSRRATLTQQQYAIENPKGWVGYDSLTWGFTATDGPGSAYNFDDKKFEGYAGRGSSGKDETVGEDGTLAPYGVLASLPFTPALSLATIKNMNAKYGTKICGKYGYYDAFNPTAKWFDHDFIGIDQGSMLLMIENFRSGLVWNYVMKDPVIQKGLKTLHFEYIK
jgi:hypothetical protein